MRAPRRDAEKPAVGGQDPTEEDSREAERALRESEARNARLVATAPGLLYEAAWFPDGTGRITHLSPRCPELFEVDGQAILDDLDVLHRMLHPDDLRALQGATLRAARERTPFSMDVRVTTPSGRAKWVQFTSCPASTSAEGVEIRSGLILDVTERKRTEEALRESDEWLRLTVEATGAGIINTVPFGPPALSPRYREMLGIPQDQAFDGFEEFLRLVHPGDREAVRRRTLEALDPSSDGRYEGTARYLRSDGTVRWLASTGKVQFAEVDGVKRAIRMASVNLDVTEREEEAAALRDSEERFRTLADNIAQHAYMFDAQGRMTWQNRRSREFGASGPSLGYLDVIHPDHRERVVERMKRCLETGEPFEDAVPLRERKGTYRSFLIQGVPLRDEAGVIVRWFGTGTDVTDLRRIEEALRESEERLRLANERLREADRRKNEFIGILSHELRNPLAPISNSAYLLRHAAPGSEAARRAQSVIERQTAHLARLVDDLLDVTRVARGKVELRRSRVDLRELVVRAADDFRPSIVDRGVALLVEVPGHELPADADPTRVAQMVGNLLHNASKYTRRGDEVTLSLAEVEGHAEIRVADTGLGIDAALLPKVFDAFVQGARTLARAEGGLGLGLALVKGLAELHGGSVRAESAGKGRGAEFVIRLPLASGGVEREPRRAEGRARDQLRRILVVDDNRDAAESLAEMLRLLGHVVDVAHDGAAAVEKARADQPDAVLCDIGLPGMTGYEVAAALRALGHGDMRLLAVSGYAAPEDVQRALEAGFDGHVAKPFDLAHIELLLSPE